MTPTPASRRRRSFFLVALVVALSASAACSFRPREGWVDVPGGKVWYRIVGKGTGTPLLVVHGGPGGMSCWLSGLGALGAERPVIFYDQLGSGRSKARPDTTLWRLERFVDELEAVRSALHLEETHLYGFSWGSTIALEYLLTRQPRGVRSVIFGSPLISTPRWIADARRLVSTLPDSVRVTLEQHEADGTTNSAEYKAATRVFAQRFGLRHAVPKDVTQGCDGAGTGNAELYRYMWGLSEFNATGTLKGYDRSARLGELSLPALFIVGRFDEATPETVSEFQRQVPGSRLPIIEGAAHGALLDAPGPYIAVVRRFLAERDSR